VNEPTLAIRDYARRIVAHETGTGPGPAQVGAGVERVFDQLRRALVELVGDIGFQVLLARATRIAVDAGYVWLDEVVTPTAPHPVHDVASVGGREGVEPVIEGGSRLLAQVIDLTSRFIGEDLMLRLIARRWPALRSDVTSEGG
jgi:hypothetical protein